MKQMQLPFMVEFREGERVMLLSKSMGDPLGSGYGYNMHKGDIGFIEQVLLTTGEETGYSIKYPPKGTKYYIVKGGLFLAGDLRRTPR